MTSTDTPTETQPDQGQDDIATARLGWQRDQASLNAKTLRAGIERLERFAAGWDNGDTYVRAAGDVAETAMWMLVEAEEDFPVLTHTHEAWLRLADRIRTRTDTLRGTVYQAPTPRIEVAPDGTEIQIGWSLKEAYEAMRHERDEACGERDTARDNYMLAAQQLKEAEGQRDEARAALADEDTLHADCAWIDDLEAQKELTKTATADASRFRTQRNVITAVAAIVIIAAIIASIAIWV